VIYIKKVQMKEDVLISIIILNYNGLEYLKKTIPSIINIQYPNKEIIILDNGSTDGSVEFIKKFKHVKLIDKGINIGYSKGKNEAVKQSTGEFVLMLDNDILINDVDILQKLKESYFKQTAFLQVPLVDVDKRETGFYGIYFSIYGVNLHKKQIEKSRILNSEQTLIEIAGATGGCMFFKREVWNVLGGFDESQIFNIDDVDIGARAVIYAYKNYLYTKAFFTHIGVVHKISKELYAKRFKLVFSGHARSMIKNYRLKNLLIHFPIFLVFQVFKAIKYSIIKRNIFVFTSFIGSVGLFFKNLPSTFKEREKIQKKRVLKNDDFLKIKTPKF